MRFSVRFPGTVLALASLVGACGNIEPINVKLITTACDASPSLDPLSGVSLLRFTVYGDGIDPFKTQVKQSLSSHAVELPNIPAGKNRNIVVEALAGADLVVSRGETGPLDLATSTDPIATAVFLRRVEAFTPMAAQDAPTSCGQLSVQRAAHTATTLFDGRVMLAGGFYVDKDGMTAYLKSTEIYDPRTGGLSPGPDMTLPRAYHTATHVPGTHLTIVVGGENQATGNTGGALKVAEVFDEDHNAFAIVQMRAARTRHAAAAPSDGAGVLILGGNTAAGRPQLSTEVFNPQTRTFENGPDMASTRSEAGAVGLSGGRVVIVGGWDGASVISRTELFVERPGSTTFERAGTDWDVSLKGSTGLLEGRTFPLVAAVRDESASPPADAYVLVTGGFTDHAPLPHQYASGSTFVIDLAAKKASAGSALAQKRGFAGIVPLLDGTILVVGGGYQDGGVTKARETAELFSPSSQPAHDGPVTGRLSGGSMKEGRSLGAYARLADGTVLATGGISYAGGTATFLRTAEVFQPPYQISTTSPYR